jgi:hypothetical protein
MGFGLRRPRCARAPRRRARNDPFWLGPPLRPRAQGPGLKRPFFGYAVAVAGGAGARGPARAQKGPFWPGTQMRPGGPGPGGQQGPKRPSFGDDPYCDPSGHAPGARAPARPALTAPLTKKAWALGCGAAAMRAAVRLWARQGPLALFECGPRCARAPWPGVAVGPSASAACRYARAAPPLGKTRPLGGRSRSSPSDGPFWIGPPLRPGPWALGPAEPEAAFFGWGRLRGRPPWRRGRPGLKRAAVPTVITFSRRRGLPRPVRAARLAAASLAEEGP